MRTWLALILMSFTLSNAYAKTPDMPITDIHRAITSQSGWLNTSRPLTAEDLQGRIILLDFWTFCCINCMHVIPDLKYLEQTFGNDLTVIGIHSAKFKNEQDSENIRSAILRYGIEHPVANDFDFSVWQRFGIRAWPTFVLINPKGLIENTYSGEGNREAIERDIRTVMKKYPGWRQEPLPVALEKDKQPPTPLSFPSKLAEYPMYSGRVNPIAVSDSGNHRILLLDTAPDGSTWVKDQIGSGSEGFKDGSFEEAEFRRPQGIIASGDYTLGKPASLIYIADTENHVLRVADMKARTVTTIAGTGKQGFERNVKNAPALQTPLASPWDMEFYPDSRHIAIAMAGTHQLWSYDIDKKTLSVIAGSGAESIDDGVYPDNSLSQPSGLSAYGGKLYFVDSETSSLRVLENGEIKTLIGTGLFDFGYKEGKQGEARMQHPLGLFADATGVYIADSYNHSIRRFDPISGILYDYAGHGIRGKNDTTLAMSEFNEPNDLLKIGDRFYVADTNNHAIRIIDPAANRVSVLNITQPDSTDNGFSSPEQLPNLQTMQPMEIGRDIASKVDIELQEGWKINGEAPSYLTLFSMEATPKAVGIFPLATVKEKHFHLPVLQPGIPYRLQGTLYYCEEEEGAQCLIKSFDIPLTVPAHTDRQGYGTISLKLN